ncbi:cell wall hydrolase [Butyrivibrio sp. MC2013]|uniref:cell wall hydrolase n=1 Tax=Butyrivibrio sp. MC2013 TaxID=1280686 RepID=UPI00055E9DC9|nr:cell wall hydrolase [Butyrivibrio sp. MC2013]
MNRRPKIRKAAAIAAALSLLAFAASDNTVQVLATQKTRQELEDAKNEREQLKDELENKKEDINNLSNTKSGLEGQLSNLNDQLQSVSDTLAIIESNIKDKESEIQETQENLQKAKEIERAQYAAMKKRIRFIYESQSFDLFEMLIGADSFGDFLNNSEYIARLSAYDRKQLVSYGTTVSYITQEEAKLQSEHAELEEYQASKQAEQSKVSGMVSSTRSSISSYSTQIDTATLEAQAKENEIAQKDEDIKALQAKLEEEIRLSKLAAASKWRDISEVSFADGDRTLLANLIYCEAGGEPYEGQLAVGSVVINRVLSSVYPDTLVGVVYQPHQFSPVGSGRLAIALAEDKATKSCYQAADQAMSGITNVGNCVYFRTPIPGLTGTQIGGHIFY